MAARVAAVEAGLQSQEKLEARLEALEEELRARADQATSAHSRVEILNARVEELESKLGRQFHNLESRLEALEGKGTGLEALLNELDIKLHAAVDTRLQPLQHTITAFEAAQHASQTDRERIDQIENQLAQLATRSEHFDSLESRLAAQEERQQHERAVDLKTSATEALALRLDALEARLSERIAELQRNVEAAGKHSETADLTSIRGVGPKYAKALVAAGLNNKTEVAAMTDAQVSEVASLLSVPEKRVRKWREAAAE